MRISSWRALAAAAVLSLCAAAAAVAQDAPAAPAYGDGADGLKQLWTDILGKATAGDEPGLRAIFEKMTLNDADFATLFGEERAKEIAPRYADKLAKMIPGEAVNLITRVRDHKYDEVEVAEVTAPDYKPIDAKEDGELKKVLPLLKPGTKLYRARLKQSGKKVGASYWEICYVNGAWKMGLRLGRLLEPEKGAKEAGAGAGAGAGTDKKDEKPADTPPAGGEPEPGK